MDDNIVYVQLDDGPIKPCRADSVGYALSIGYRICASVTEYVPVPEPESEPEPVKEPELPMRRRGRGVNRG